MPTPIVSVVTPNYNSARYIEETYNSLLMQAEKNWEWVITDDGSTDDSTAIIKNLANKDSRIKYIQRTVEEKGASVCRNIGINHSTGRFIIFLDADDLLSPCCLIERTALMEQKSGLDFAIFKMGYFKNKIGDTVGTVNRYEKSQESYLNLFLKYEIPWAITCPIWKREFLIKNNIRFSEKYPRLQDPEFHSKILLQYHPTFEVLEGEEPDCFYRQSVGKKKASSESLQKIVSSFLLYYREMNYLIKSKQKGKKYEDCLDSFAKNIFHSLLFYTRLDDVEPILNLYKKMNEVRPIKQLSPTLIMWFGFANKMGITFIKGAGITKMWKIFV